MHSTRSLRPFDDVSGSREGHPKVTSYPLQVEDDVRSSFEHSGESEDLLETVEVERRRELGPPEKAGTIFVRAVALLCACSLSIGSH